jgi:hypothetical protein
VKAPINSDLVTAGILIAALHHNRALGLSMRQTQTQVGKVAQIQRPTGVQRGTSSCNTFIWSQDLGGNPTLTQSIRRSPAVPFAHAAGTVTLSIRGFGGVRSNEPY